LEGFRKRRKYLTSSCTIIRKLHGRYNVVEMQLNELLIETLKAKQVKSDAVSALERERKEMKIETERLENIVESAEAEVLKNELALNSSRENAEVLENELALRTRNYEKLSRRHDEFRKRLINQRKMKRESKCVSSRESFGRTKKNTNKAAKIEKGRAEPRGEEQGT